MEEFSEALDWVRALTDRQAEFYKLVGICIKEWAKIEDQLFDLCEYALKAEQKHVAIIYYRTPSIDTRLKLTTELILSTLPQRKKMDGGHDHPMVVDWKKIDREISNLFPTRNLLAHSPVEQTMHPPITEEERKNRIVRSTETMEVRTSDKERLRGRDQLHSIRDALLEQHLTQIRVASKHVAAFFEGLQQVRPGVRLRRKSRRSPGQYRTPKGRA